MPLAERWPPKKTCPVLNLEPATVVLLVVFAGVISAGPETKKEYWLLRWLPRPVTRAPTGSTQEAMCRGRRRWE